MRSVTVNRPPRWLVVTPVLGALALGAAGAWFYLAQRRYLQQTASANLLAIAQTKLDEIVAWQTERLGDAAVLQESPFFVRAVARWLAGRQPEIAADILTRLRSTRDHIGYDDVRLVDRAGRVVQATSGRLGPLDSDEAGALREAFRDRRPTIGAVYVSADDSIPHLAVVVPLFASSPRAAEPIGAVVLVVDPRRSFLRLVESWPGRSPSAEANLVRRDGDSVLFLSERRFQPSPASPRRISLSRRDVPAVMAVLGTEGVMRGVDYRGVRVISALRAVRGTPWFLVVKVDEAEVLAVWRTRVTPVLAVLLGLVLVAGASVIAVRQRVAKVHYRRLYEAQAALLASEARFRALVEEAGDAFALLDAEGRYLDVNSACCRQLGYTREELLRLSVADTDALFPPGQFAADLRTQQFKPSVVYLSAHRRKDGTTFPVEVALSVVWIDGVPQVLSLARDITERKRAEEALREKEHELRVLFEELPVGVSLMDQNRRITYANQRLEEILGLSRDDLLQGKHQERRYLRSDGTPMPPEEYASVRAFREQRPIHGVETGIVVEDGRTIWTSVSAAPFPMANKGVLITTADITARKRAEEARERLAALVESSEDTIISASTDGTILTWNRAAERMFGYTAQEAIGRSISITFPPERAEEMLRNIRSFNLGQSVGPYETERVRSDGRVISVAVSLSPIKDGSGRVVGASGIVRDVTERLRGEKALLRSQTELRALARHLQSAREEEHTRMARDIHDELGQALTALRLDLSWLGKKLPEAGPAVQRRIGAMVALTDDTIEAGRRIAAELRPPILDDLGLAPSLEWYVQQFAKRAGLRYEWDPGPTELAVDREVAVITYRIVQEALTNVARHAQAKHLAVRLGEQDGQLTIEIRDDGRGISEDAVTSPHSLGIVGMRERALVRGGSLTVIPLPGGGTSVRLTMPIERRREPRAPR